MASRRTKSIGTTVTPEEYKRIQTLASEQPVSEWVRDALQRAADPPAADATVLAEVLALRPSCSTSTSTCAAARRSLQRRCSA
jgi:hypothetical protein